MKPNVMRDVLIVSAFAGFAYAVMRNYKRRKRRERESREFVHFQLF